MNVLSSLSSLFFLIPIPPSDFKKFVEKLESAPGWSNQVRESDIGHFTALDLDMPMPMPTHDFYKTNLLL